MKRYKITLKNRWGEATVVTVTASSLYEAMKKIEITPGWHFAEYCEIGGMI